MQGVVEELLGGDSEARRKTIVEVFVEGYGEEMARSTEAWRGKFRKMAASPFAFYRGSAALFYADVAREADPFCDERTRRLWIQGDLHAENFGTYMNADGILVFDVNDFDESYVGPFTWDLGRLAASLALIGYQKALSDDDIGDVIGTLANSYSRQVARFATGQEADDYALTLENTEGAVFQALQQARLRTRVDLLDRFTLVDNYERRFRLSGGARAIDDAHRARVEAAFADYVTTIPKRRRLSSISYTIRDVVLRHGMGIGSAGLPSYSIVLEGPTQAFENDILLFMKQAQPAAPSRVVRDPSIRAYFEHDGHRTAVSQRALQASADPWLGYTTLEGKGQLVAEVQPNTCDLDWDEINSLPEIRQTVDYLGQALAKIHCVLDVDSDQDLVNFSTEQALHENLRGRDGAFARWLIDFGMGYGTVVRHDYERFVDAFRNHEFPGL